MLPNLACHARCSFVPRHNSGTASEVADMVAVAGFKSVQDLIVATVPKAIVRHDGMPLGKYHDGMCESEFLDYFK